MTIGDLYPMVTSAIRKAEELPEGSVGAKTAWFEVARLEEEISKITSRDEAEGKIARRGMITAVVKAGDILLARKLLTDLIRDGEIDQESIDHCQGAIAERVLLGDQ